MEPEHKKPDYIKFQVGSAVSIGQVICHGSVSHCHFSDYDGVCKASNLRWPTIFFILPLGQVFKQMTTCRANSLVRKRLFPGSELPLSCAWDTN